MSFFIRKLGFEECNRCWVISVSFPFLFSPTKGALFRVLKPSCDTKRMEFMITLQRNDFLPWFNIFQTDTALNLLEGQFFIKGFLYIHLTKPFPQRRLSDPNINIEILHKRLKLRINPFLECGNKRNSDLIDNSSLELSDSSTEYIYQWVSVIIVR